MVPIAAIISFVLLGIEEIGVYIEEPFSLLPLENLCDKLSRILSSEWLGPAGRSGGAVSRRGGVGSGGEGNEGNRGGLRKHCRSLRRLACTSNSPPCCCLWRT